MPFLPISAQRCKVSLFGGGDFGLSLLTVAAAAANVALSRSVAKA
jgi:hypothetical protein